MSASVDPDRIQTSKELERCPFPIPFGWYVIDREENVPPGEVRVIQAFDQELVLFRGEDGTVGLSDPYCPHLGAHLGHGGEVVGNNIRCPFHHWEYDAKGWCKNIPYGRGIPDLARRKPVLRTFPVEQRYGLIFAWYHPDAIEPTFPIPRVPELETEGYIEPRHGEWDIRTCLQEIGENSVDFPHLKFLHGRPDIPEGKARQDGHIFHFDIADGHITGEAHGPGLQIVRHNNDKISMLMFSTPLAVTPELTRTRMHFTFKDYPEGSEERKIAENLYEHSIGAVEGEDSAGFEAVDLIVWDNKKYRPRPLLCSGDGPIVVWRKYFQQFYPEGTAV